MSVDETVTYWSGYNNTDSNPNVTTVGNIENSSYKNGDSNSAVDLFKINGGGHDWFSLDFNGSNLEELIWYFLSQHTSDQLYSTMNKTAIIALDAFAPGYEAVNI